MACPCTPHRQGHTAVSRCWLRGLRLMPARGTQVVARVSAAGSFKILSWGETPSSAHSPVDDIWVVSGRELSWARPQGAFTGSPWRQMPPLPPGESRGVDDRVLGKVHVSLRNCKLFFKQLEPPTLTVDSDPPLPVAGQYPWLKVRRCGGEWQFRFQCAGL